MSDPNSYTVGWICAITTEYIAAQTFLDEKHEGPAYLSRHNKNDYTLGRIGKHNVVISVLPLGIYGTSSATRVAEDLVHSFPNVRIGLMVGIGGGAPSAKHDIRLGDIVVSVPHSGQSGVIQYDFGKTIQDQSFQPMGVLNQPPTILLAAVNGLRAQYEMEGHRLEELVSKALEKKPRLQGKYKRPGNDRLYHSWIVHPPENKSSCYIDCGDDLNSLVWRNPRSEDNNPVIHYGLIASANQLMKDALIRDRLAAEKDVLCFEMEAAGLMNNFPCLVIRGISDYSDSHKNDIWQGYASMIAAAYARDLLCRIVPQQVEREEKILYSLTPSIDHMAKTADLIDQSLGLDKLPVVSGAEYNSYTDQYEEECFPGTRTELLQQIKRWALSPPGKFLFWLNGMAGTGKSTISRTIANFLRKTNSLGASFFFKRGEGDRNSAMKLFSTFARQLAISIPQIIPGLQKAVRDDPGIGSKSLREQFDKILLQPLLNIDHLGHLPRVFVLVIDALDECENDKDIPNIIQLLPLLQQAHIVRIRVFLTSRPELSIRLGFQKISNKDYEDLALHKIPEKLTENDISLFIKDKFMRIRLQRGIPCDWPGDGIIDKLVAISTPLFISAATVCRYIEHPKWDPRTRLAELLRDQAKYINKMDKIYLPVLTRLLGDQDTSALEQQQLLTEFHETIGIIILLAIPLSLNALSRFIGTRAEIISNRLDSFRSALSIPNDPDHPIKILHSSFRDFLIHTDTAFHVKSDTKNFEIGLYCLKTMASHLKKDICNIKNPGASRTEIDSLSIQLSLPSELQYSCRYWAYHLDQSKVISSQMEDAVFRFLQQHLLHWMEAMAILDFASEVVIILNLLLSIFNAGRSLKLFELLLDARRFFLRHKQVAHEFPLQIYYSGLIFAPQKSIIRRTFEDQLPNWMCLLSGLQDTWNANILTLEGHSDWISSVAFSSRGDLLASGSYDKTIRIWDTITGTLHQVLKGHSDSVQSVAFSPSVQKLASGSADGTVRLWDTDTGELCQILRSCSGPVYSVEFSPTGQLIASGSGDKTIQLWDATTFSLRYTLHGHVERIKSVAFSPDSQLLASGGEDKMIRLWDVTTGRPQLTITGHFDSVESVRFSPDGRLVVSSSADETIRLWSCTTGILQQVFEDHSGVVSSIGFSPDSRWLVSSSEDDTIRLWDKATSLPQQILEGHSAWVTSATFSPDGRMLASGSWDRTVRLWLPNPNLQEQCLSGYSGRVDSIKFSYDGQILASSHEDGYIRLWDATSYVLLRELESYSSRAFSLSFSKDGRFLASSSEDCIVSLWNVLTGTLQKRLRTHLDRVYSLDFDSECSLFAFGTKDNVIHFLDCISGVVQQVFKGHSSLIESIALSPYGRQLAAGTYDKTVLLWDVATGALVQEFKTTGIVTTLQFSRTGSHLDTNFGPLTTLSNSNNFYYERQGVEIFVEENQWITVGGKRILWLPPEHRSRCFTVKENSLAIGNASGRISLICLLM